MQEQTKARLRGLPGSPVYKPLSWYTATQQQSKVGHHDNWGWIMTPGLTPHYLDIDSPVQSQPWIDLAHTWLEKNKTGHHQGLDILPAWQRYMKETFAEKYPELAQPDVPAMRRPWIDAGVVQVQRTRNGVEVRYSCTGLIAIGIHSGINDKWILPPSIEWHRQHFEKHAAKIASVGFESPAGKKELMAWHTYCRQSINQQGGFSGWVVGDELLKGWSSGRVHVSETPFSVVLYNVGALSLVDTFKSYPSHKDVFDYIRTHKRMDVLLDKLHDAEIKDPHGKKYPRPVPHTPVGILTVHGD